MKREYRDHTIKQIENGWLLSVNCEDIGEDGRYRYYRSKVMYFKDTPLAPESSVFIDKVKQEENIK